MTTPDDVAELRSLLLDTAPTVDPAAAERMLATTFAAGDDHGLALLPDEAFLVATPFDPHPSDDPFDGAPGGVEPHVPDDHPDHSDHPGPDGGDDGGPAAHDDTAGHDTAGDDVPDDGHLDQTHHDPGDTTWGL